MFRSSIGIGRGLRKGKWFPLKIYCELLRPFTWSSKQHGRMKAWYLDSYDTYTGLKLGSFQVPTVGPDEVLVKVEAASVNPLDTEMARGYGQTLMNSLRKVQSVNEFPLILGRDCSGTIVQRGRKVRRFSVGETVWCARWVIGQGTHSTYVAAKVNEVARKPENLSHEEAASIPFVACTVWPSLVSRGGLTPHKPGKRVLVVGASGGIGSFAVQLARYMQAIVSTVAREETSTQLMALGAHEVYDYRDAAHFEVLKKVKPFDVILDCRGGSHDNIYRPYLANDPSATYISLMSPVLPYIDRKGLALGVAESAFQMFCANKDIIFQRQGIYSWGFYFPSGGILEEVRKLVEQGVICPVIDSVYSFPNGKVAFKKLLDGNVVGKVVISMGNNSTSPGSSQ